MKKRKSIAVAIVLALVLLIGGLLAYFTDTDRKQNKFSLDTAAVDIELTEPNWSTTDTNSNNIPDAAEGLQPGATLDKDPTVTNITGGSGASATPATPAFVFAEVTVPCYDSDNDGDVDTAAFTLNSIGSGWYLMDTSAVDTTNNTITYTYAYGTSSAMTSLDAQDSTTPVFSSVTLVSTLTPAQAATVSAGSIDVEVKAIQTDGHGQTTPSGVYALL